MTHHLYHVGEKGRTDERNLQVLLKQMFQFQVIKQSSIKRFMCDKFVATSLKQQASVQRSVTMWIQLWDWQWRHVSRAVRETRSRDQVSHEGSKQCVITFLLCFLLGPTKPRWTEPNCCRVLPPYTTIIIFHYCLTSSFKINSNYTPMQCR